MEFYSEVNLNVKTTIGGPLKIQYYLCIHLIGLFKLTLSRLNWVNWLLTCRILSNLLQKVRASNGLFWAKLFYVLELHFTWKFLNAFYIWIMEEAQIFFRWLKKPSCTVFIFDKGSKVFPESFQMFSAVWHGFEVLFWWGGGHA